MQIPALQSAVSKPVHISFASHYGDIYPSTTQKIACERELGGPRGRETPSRTQAHQV